MGTLAKPKISTIMMLVYGVLLWLVTLLVSVILGPVKGSNLPLFDALMPVAIAFLTVFFLCLYFRDVRSGFFRSGLIAGIAWLIINLAFDLLFIYTWGPMAKPFAEYVYEIGVMYFIIPVITAGTGYLMDYALKRPI